MGPGRKVTPGLEQRKQKSGCLMGQGWVPVALFNGESEVGEEEEGEASCFSWCF